MVYQELDWDKHSPPDPNSRDCSGNRVSVNSFQVVLSIKEVVNRGCDVGLLTWLKPKDVQVRGNVQRMEKLMKTNSESQTVVVVYESIAPEGR